ncbi:MAG: hypothetical protein ACRDDK_00385, partial [Cetobacterium sp.]
KNIATYPKFQGQGCAKKLIKFIFEYYKNNYNTILVGTGEAPSIINFIKIVVLQNLIEFKIFLLITMTI